MSEYAGSRSRGPHEGGAADSAARSPGKQTLVEQGAPVQLREGGDGAAEPADVKQLAHQGTQTARGSLPYFDVIQAAFGHHDISGLIAHTDDAAGATATGMGAKGYTAGRHVVLGPGSDLFTVAHEAAHFIEQQHGLVSVAGGVGKAGDVHEQRADAVAAKVVAGESAEGLLDEYVGKGKGGKGGGAPAGADGGPVQKKEKDETTVAAAKTAQRGATLEHARGFERKLGVYAYGDQRSDAIANTMIDRMTQAVIPDFDADRDEHKTQYGDLFGREDLGDSKDYANGRWSAGQVGKEFETLRTALRSGNLREKMTGLFNAAMGGFKQAVMQLREEDAATRGLDAKKAKSRQRWAKTPKFLGGGDMYRNPGNPLDRKHVFNGKDAFERKSVLDWESSSDSRVKRPEAEHQTDRTVGELESAGIGLSEREKRFQFGTAEVDDAEAVKWKEGGTIFQPNDDSKYVQKYRDKLLMPLTAGPSGTALRMFQAWELLGKPPEKEHFRLALLGWMLTGNDHSFHEIMTTSAQYGMPYTPGLDAYRDIAPLSEAELRGIARPEGFPDEQEYLDQHARMPEPDDEAKEKSKAKAARGKGQHFERHPRIAEGEPVAVFTGARHAEKLNERLQIDPEIERQQKGRSEALQDLRGTPDDQISQILGLLLYSDDRKKPGGVSAFEFINTVLRDDIGMRIALRHHIKKDPALKKAFDENKFNIKDLILEAKQHGKFAAEGLKRMNAYNGQVYRGYKSMTKPSAGASWVEKKFLSMSTNEELSRGYATNDSLGIFSILVTMQSVSGRKIDAASMFGAEGEVLFAPGSRFTVIGKPEPWEGVRNGYRVTWRDDSPAPATPQQGDDQEEQDAGGSALPPLAINPDEISVVPASSS